MIMLSSKFISNITSAFLMLLGMFLLASEAQAITTSTTSMAFGNMQVGTSSIANSVTLTNTGKGPLFYQGAVITGVNTTNFTIQADNCIGKVLAKKDKCKIYVTFLPDALGNKLATLTLSDGSRNKKVIVTQTVALSGAGVAPAGSALPNPVAFGNMQVGTPSVAKTLTLTNTGLGALTFNSAAISGTNPADFAIKTNNCTGKVLDPASLVGGSSTCTIDVTFMPSALLARSATLTLTDGAGTIMNVSQSVRLTGTGVAPAGSALPNPVAFGNMQVGTPSVAKTLTLTNTGLGALTFNSAAISGTNPADFAIKTNNCTGKVLDPASLVGGSSTCTIDVTFTPSALLGRSATLTLSDGAGTMTVSQIVSLTGTGVLPSASLMRARASRAAR